MISFDEAVDIASLDARTLIWRDRLHYIYHAAVHAEKLGGAMAELGVYRGGVCAMLKAMFPTTEIYAFDTFTGIPNAGPDDDHINGQFADNHDAVAFLKRHGMIPIVGEFQRMSRFVRVSRFCFAHFDGNTYQSCKEFLEFFYPKLPLGGILILDDYSKERTHGVKKACDEYSVHVIPTTPCQGMIIKS